MSVANVNLMEQRQNLLIVSGVLAVVGAILSDLPGTDVLASPDPAWRDLELLEETALLF